MACDPATIIDVLLHCVETLIEFGRRFDIVAVVLPTSPLVEVSDISGAVKLFLKSGDCSVLSVCEAEFPPYNAWTKSGNGNLIPAFPDSKFAFTKSTECPQTFRSNGAIMVCSVKNLLQERTYRNVPIVPYIMPTNRSVDIDTAFDFEYAKFLFNRQSCLSL